MIITLGAVENSKRLSGQEISQRQVTSNRSNGKPRYIILPGKIRN